jgi:Mrp family chromosome partitioning ATPase
VDQGEIQNLFDVVFRRVGAAEPGREMRGIGDEGPTSEEINEFFGSLHSFRRFAYTSRLSRYMRTKPSRQILSVLKNLQFHSTASNKKLYAVTSLTDDTPTVPLSAMLALAYGKQEVGRVLLVDAGNPRTGLSRQLGIAVHVSIFDLFGGTALADVAVTSEEMYCVVPTRAAEDAPGEWFSHPNAGGVLSEMKRFFDIVLVDTPPISQSIDSILLSRFGGGIILNVKAESITREGLATVKQRFEDMEIPLAGIVLWDERRYLPHWIDRIFGTRDLMSA